MKKLKQWYLLRDLVEAKCPLCLEFGWPTNDKQGRLSHTHELLTGVMPCRAEKYWKALSAFYPT